MSDELPPSPTSTGRSTSALRASPSVIPRISARTVDASSIACQRCHRRKKKCDRAKPSCGACVKSRMTCTYDVVISDRSHPHYVRDLLAETSSQKERIVELEKQVAELTSLASGVQNEPQLANTSLHQFAALINNEPSTTFTEIPFQPFPTGSIGIEDVSSEPTLAERIVLQVLTTEPDRREASLSFKGTIGQQLGTSQDDEECGDGSSTGNQIPGQNQNDLSTWPPDLPILDRVLIEQDLHTIYFMTSPRAPLISEYSKPDIRIYRLFMIFAIGCDVLEKGGIALLDHSKKLRAYAFHHLPAVLRADSLSCIAGLLLYAQYSIMAFGNTSPHAVIGLIARLAIDLNYHQEDYSLPPAEQDTRRRLFWTIFSMDRLISSTLTKPLTVPEEIITVQLPKKVGGSSRYQMAINSDEYFRHVVLLRRLNGHVLNEVYLINDAQKAQGEQTLAKLRNQIDDWFHSTPRSPEDGSYNPFLKLCYNLLITALYRPSPLFSHTHPSRMSRLRKSASRAIDLYGQLYAQKRCAENYVHLFNIVTVSVTLVYTLIEREGDDLNLEISSWCREAVRQMVTCEKLINDFCKDWPGTAKYREAFNALANEVKTKMKHSSPSTGTETDDRSPMQAQSQPLDIPFDPFVQANTQTPQIPQDITISTHIPVSGTSATSTSGLALSPTLFEGLVDTALWNQWTLQDNGIVGQVDPERTEDPLGINMSGVGIDALLASVGLSAFTDFEWDSNSQSR
ncbi:hypothetical protein L486_03225 [Kwoniella mangroviensis CBS 10435]|uniref:Zn(2)-C6 fungal-type domain-containing protein n=1 Tax=Kwoniella mangroviensis CBS 10435 TaxID=1331196 RepID=A0A1B9IT83_9TREE|nr:hypothetical protein L486_03225 [Kwoniella mangroviensis CBS 10435]